MSLTDHIGYSGIIHKGGGQFGHTRATLSSLCLQFTSESDHDTGYSGLFYLTDNFTVAFEHARTLAARHTRRPPGVSVLPTVFSKSHLRTLIHQP